VGAVAAVLLIFLWTSGWHTRMQLPATPKKDVSSQSEMPQEAKVAATPKPLIQQDEQTQADETVADASESATYAASDFVPVPFTGTITPEDPGMVVRVQLTRASLAQLGYPVAETPDEDLILADVLVGEDGWPRGVKLIQ
jgi:hypothetical protein